MRVAPLGIVRHDALGVGTEIKSHLLRPLVRFRPARGAASILCRVHRRSRRTGRSGRSRRTGPRSGTKRTVTPLTSPTLGSTAFAMGPRDVSVGFYFVVYFASMRKGGWRGRDGAPFRRGASRLSPFHAKHDTSNAGPPDRLPRRVEINRRRTRN